MKVVIRETKSKDFFQTENLTRETFWNLYTPGCVEHLVLNKIRKSKSYIEKLDIVALHEEQIIGHMISSKAKVIDTEDNEHEVLCVGPISVLSELQQKGIGSKLIESSISTARNLGYKGMILFGNPDYYHRFGFRNAKEYEIATKDGQNFDPFMALELKEKALDDVKGRFFEDEAFSAKEDELVEFEKKFPVKEKGKPKIDIIH